MRRALLAGLLLLAACEAEPQATTAPTYQLSAPTLAASPVFFPVAPTSEPVDALLAGQNDPTAAAVASGGELPPLALGTVAVGQVRSDVQITAGDGTQLSAALYLPAGAEPAFPVLLLASQGEGWGDFPLALAGRGLAVLDLSLRPGAPIGDVLSAFDSLAFIGRVDVGRVAIVGGGAGADLALAACAGAVPCDAMALISPRSASEQAMFTFNPRPLFLAASAGDSAGQTNANALRAVARGPVEAGQSSSTASGAPLVAGDAALAAQLADWLERTLYEAG